MDIRLIKNFTKGKYRAVNSNLMLQIVDDNRKFDKFYGKKFYLFNPAKNVHEEIMPEIAKFDVFRIYNGLKDKNFFFFSSFKMLNESDVEISYYYYNISKRICKIVHKDVVKLWQLRQCHNFKIFALTEDYCMFQKYDSENESYDIQLKDIMADKGVRISNDELVKNGLDCIIPMGGNKCCFKVGETIVGIVNVNQFVSDMVLNLPMVFSEVLDKSAGDVLLTDMYDSNRNIIYTKIFPDSDVEEVVIYDYVNGVKKVRQIDNKSDFFNKNLCVINDVPYIYLSDETGTHFVNLNSQREECLIPEEYKVEVVFGEYVVTSRPVKINILKKNKRIIQVFRIPDISHPVFKKKGVYNGHVTLDEDLLMFVS